MKKILAALAFLPAVSAHALDAVSLELGRGNDAVDMARAGVQWQWANGWGYWEASVGAWDGARGAILDVGITPVFRTRGRYFAEAAIGAHWLSSGAIAPARDFATRFQFGDHVGVGMRLEKYDLTLRLQHLSNGGIRNPNPGINFVQLQVRRALR